ncbi:FAD-binding oxidoreductase [Candidatus Bathyarchaeota archaeon]|nr:MAG: FAD-binding oxidoreductase [Candidatus Bathyarchaeota archaeon]
MEYDAIVVGAGLFGLATAYHIKELRPEDRILLLERLGGPGQGNTAKSAALFRAFFSSRTNLALADSSIEFYRHVQEELGHDLRMRFVGYLWLLTSERYEEVKPVLDRLAKRGVRYELYDGEHLRKTLGLNVEVSGDEEARIMGLPDVGYGLLIVKAGCMDVDRLVRFYEEEVREKGVEIRYGVKVEELLVEPKKPLGLPREPLIWQEARVSGVKTSSGVFKAKKTILATGAWTPKLLDPLGIECHIKAKKRQIFSIKAEGPELKKLLHTEGYNPENCMPVIILPEPSIYVRPVLEEEAFWTGYADEFPREFRTEDEPAPEPEFYEYGIYQVLVKYLPQFKGARPYSSWAGQYAYCTLDCQPVVFEEHDVMVVSGGSGSGVMKADAVGRIAAALYAGEEYAELYGGEKFRVSDLGLEERRVEPEELVL